MQKQTCVIDGCANPAHARGWCSKHYWRWHRNGDPLAGSTGNGEPLRFIEGVLLSDSDQCVFWPFGKAGKGYGVFHVDGEQIYAHRFVCEKVRGAPPSPLHEAAHSCGNGHRGCITPNHLRWATVAENHSDKLLHGTANRGERHGLAKLTEADVLKIRALGGSLSQEKIGLSVGCSRSQVKRVLSGECWGWLK